MAVSDIPTLNALLNGLATVLISAGFILIKTGRIRAHRICMVSAFGVSIVFLVGYVTHKVLVRGVHTPFGGEGALRAVYYTMLLTHILLAMIIAPLVLRTLWLAVRGEIDRHRRWARWTFPIWYYVSVTGVLIYLFLYVWFPAAA
ncbi:MAG: DUF420 domain-containing protein [Opitutaceae bacterium]